MPASTLAAEALAYASRGIKIFPLWHARNGVCVCREGTACENPAKHPRVRWKEQATSDERQVEAWWAMWPHANIGLPAGANGLAIIDVDRGHGGWATFRVLSTWMWERHHIDLWATHHIRTGSHGGHFYFLQPPGGIKSAAQSFGDDAPGVDTRGNGGYVVAPPSVHVTGGIYQAVPNGLTPAPWPAPLTRLMERSQPQPAQTLPAHLPSDVRADLRDMGREQRWAQGALNGICAELAAMPAGEGHGKNGKLNACATKLGRLVGAGLLDEANVRDALLAATAGWKTQQYRDRLRAINGGLEHGKRNPRTAPIGSADSATGTRG